jgi:hypothetical protein
MQIGLQKVYVAGPLGRTSIRLIYYINGKRSQIDTMDSISNYFTAQPIKGPSLVS